MTPRTTRSLVLGLIGSAAILTLFWSCQARQEEPNQQNLAEGGQPGTTNTHRTSSGYTYYRSRPWYWGWGSSYSSSPRYYSSPSSFRTSSGSTGRSTSSSTVTSRGGFGGIGSGHSSGS